MNNSYRFFIIGIIVLSSLYMASILSSPKAPELPNSITALDIPAIQSNPATLSINNPQLSPVAEATQETQETTLSHKIKKGESLSTIFSKLDLSKSDLHKLIHTNESGKQFALISPGKTLHAVIDSNGQLQQLSYQKNALDTLIATRINDEFDIELSSKPKKVVVTSTHTIINSSLFIDGKEAGLPDKLIMELAGIFAWDIDFALSLRKGDEFTVLYEQIFVDDKKIDTGNILSAEFINQGHAYTAVRFVNKEGSGQYFTPEGKSMRKAFLRTPVDFARISSRFNLRRKHPVLNRIRAHKGVDYAAKSGTPIKTTGDGKIIYRGRKGGYGRVVIVQHGQKYSTLYAHMSGFKKGQKTGTRVKQGQIIGYVGKSGLATGSHLHYEFRINGVHRNPLTVRLPQAKPINKSLLAKFKKQTQPLISQLNTIKAKNLIAQNTP